MCGIYLTHGCEWQDDGSASLNVNTFALLRSLTIWIADCWWWLFGFIFNNSMWKTDTGRKCFAESTKHKGEKIASLPGCREFCCDSLCCCWTRSSLLLFFSCCRQKSDQSVLGVCFIAGILHCQSQRQGTFNQRQTDDGNLWCARWACVIQ